MAWTKLNTITPTTSWQFTSLTDAIYFRLKHIDSPFDPHLWICQADVGNGIQLADIRELPYEYLTQILRLDVPKVFPGSRAIGIKSDTESSRWQVQIDKSDYVETNSSTTTPTATAASSVAYTASQSSVYSGTSAATYQTLNDTNGTTGGATNAGNGQFIRADFGQPVLVKAITVGGGNLPNWGPVAAYLNSRNVEYSTDNATWVNAFTISGITDSGSTQFKKTTLNTPITARYWRISIDGYVSTTEFKFE